MIFLMSELFVNRVLPVIGLIVFACLIFSVRESAFKLKKE
jgi:hypothetical protein